MNRLFNIAQQRRRLLLEGGLSINPILQRVLDYATTNAITKPTGATLIALNTYCNDLETAGILAHTGSGGIPSSASDFTVSDVFVNFAYNDLALEEFSTICWIRLVEMTIHGGMTYTLNGWKGNGTNGYLGTGFIPNSHGNNFSQNNASMGHIQYSEGNNTLSGVAETLTNCIIGASSNIQRLNSVANLSASVNMAGTGLKIISRESSSENKTINKATVTSATSASISSPLSYEMLILRRTTAYGTSEISSYFNGGSISNIIAQDVRTAYNAYLTSIGLSAIA